MMFEGAPVPGAEWVEIVHITNKDGSPLAEDNWRHKLFGRVTLCWIAGGLRKRGAFFKGRVQMENGVPVEIDMASERWCSTTTAQPVEVEPGIFDFETNTSIYRFRILNESEVEAIHEAIRVIMNARFASLANAQAGPDGPVS